MYYWINKRRVDLEHLIKKKDKLEAMKVRKTQGQTMMDSLATWLVKSVISATKLSETRRKLDCPCQESMHLVYDCIKSIK